MLSIVCEPFACIIPWLRNLTGRAIQSRCIATKPCKNEDTDNESSTNKANRREDEDPKPKQVTKKSRLAIDWNNC